MSLVKKITNIIDSYRNIYRIVEIKKSSYFFVIILTFITVILDALGISVLLPIGEYILNYDGGKIPNTPSWKIINKVFEFLTIETNVVVVIGFIIIIIILRQLFSYSRGLLIEKINFRSLMNLRKALFSKFFRRDFFFYQRI